MTTIDFSPTPVVLRGDNRAVVIARLVVAWIRRYPVKFWIPALFLLGVVVCAVFAPLLAPYSPDAGSVANRLLSPGAPGHLLGTDGNGRDILSRLMWGARPSLIEGFLPVLFASFIGGALGLIAGLSGSRTYSVVMRSLDVLYSFPAVLLAIALASALGAGVTSTIIALSIVLIAPIARVVSTEARRVRSADFMEAARASGASMPVIAIKHVVPLVMPTLIVYCTALIGLAIVFAGGLSFLGLGIAPPAPEWGAMLDDLAQNLYETPLLALIPALMIFVTSFALNVLGDALRDIFDVRSSRRS